MHLHQPLLTESMQFKEIIYSFAGVNAVCLLVVGGNSVAQQVSSQNQLTARRQGLEAIAKHIKADTCWSNNAEIPFKLGDEITLKGTADGKIPTECIRVPKTAQYLQVAYSGGILRVNQAYSNTEVRNQLSIKGDK